MLVNSVVKGTASIGDRVEAVGKTALPAPLGSDGVAMSRALKAHNTTMEPFHVDGRVAAGFANDASSATVAGKSCDALHTHR